jgi:hypothetical protein
MLPTPSSHLALSLPPLWIWFSTGKTLENLVAALMVNVESSFCNLLLWSFASSGLVLEQQAQVCVFKWDMFYCKNIKSYTISTYFWK